MVRNAGAREVHLRISCPPTISPCFYGVDTPTKRELIAANQTVDEIRQFIDCDTLAYLSLDKLSMAVRDTNAEHRFCYACYTGKYPTELVNIDELMTSRPNRC
jgi:amidophosphoribosyltransferase